MQQRKRALVFGLDGATWSIIKPLADKGVLPTFKKLMNAGAWGTMDSVIPPGTPSGWSSIMSGFTPSKHGYFNFVKINKDYSLSLCLSDTMKSKAIWDHMDENGKRSLLINIPTSYPPQRINGVVVAGMQAPGLNSEFTHPSNIRQYVLESVPNYTIDLEFRIYGQGKQFLRALQHSTNQRLSLFKHLANKDEYDFMCLVITETDRLQHLWWNDKALSKFYVFLDEILSEIVTECQKRDALLFIVSDHGFGKIKRQISINSFLHEKGYLKYKHAGQNRVTTLRYKVHDIGLDPLVNILPLKMRQWLKNRFMESDAEKASRIDWSQTKAFTITSFCEIILNSERRFSQGIIASRDIRELKQKIINDLEMWVDSETGLKPLQAVYDAEYLYTDTAQLDEFGDIAVLPSMKDGYAATPHYQEKPIIPAHKETGNHDVPGVFLAYGDWIKDKGYLGNVSIYDVAPTILHVYGLPVPQDIDGRVLTEIFADDSEAARRPVRYQEVDEQQRLRARIKDIKESGDL